MLSEIPPYTPPPFPVFFSLSGDTRKRLTPPLRPWRFRSQAEDKKLLVWPTTHCPPMYSRVGVSLRSRPVVTTELGTPSVPLTSLYQFKSYRVFISTLLHDFSTHLQAPNRTWCSSHVKGSWLYPFRPPVRPGPSFSSGSKRPSCKTPWLLCRSTWIIGSVTPSPLASLDVYVETLSNRISTANFSPTLPLREQEWWILHVQGWGLGGRRGRRNEYKQFLCLRDTGTQE